MSIGLVVFWAAVGWCGTWPRPWPWPIPKGPTPFPWLISRVIGIVGGLIGGFLFNQAWPIGDTQGLAGLAVAASGVGAFVGAIILLDVYHLVQGGTGTATSE